MNHAFKLVLLFYFLFASNLNTFQTDGTCGQNDRFSQFDELVAIGEVNAIVNPGDAKHFVFFSLIGTTAMYGRAMFYVDGIVSYFPYKIWGLKGQIIATRIVHTFVLLLSFYLLIIVFVSNSLMRLIASLFLCLMPYTLYFSIVPKPEPYLLLFVSLFLYFSNLYHHKKSWVFVFLGLALASKISVLAILPFFAFYFIYINKGEWLKKTFWAGFYFVIGLFVGVPALMIGIVKRIYLTSYIEQTFGTVNQAYDDANMNAFVWIKYFFAEYFAISIWVLIPLISIMVYFLFKNHKIKFKLNINNFVLISGLFMMVLVFVTTKRLWPHYLYVSLVLLIIGVISQIKESKYSIYIGLSLVFLILPEFMTLYNQSNYLLNREENELYKETKLNSELALDYIQNEKTNTPVAIDLTAYLPNELFVKACRSQPFSSDIKESEFRLSHINNMGESLYSSNKCIVFNEANPPTKKVKDNQIETPDQKESLKVFNQFVPSVFSKDSSFGKIHVYIKIN
jgi:hypothetical protein